MKTFVVGFSEDPNRFSNKAFKMLTEHSHQAIGINPSLTSPYFNSINEACKKQGNPDTITMYVKEEISKNMKKDILESKPKRVIFNPGAENKILAEELRKDGIEVVELHASNVKIKSILDVLTFFSLIRDSSQDLNIVRILLLIFIVILPHILWAKSSFVFDPHPVVGIGFFSIQNGAERANNKYQITGLIYMIDNPQTEGENWASLLGIGLSYGSDYKLYGTFSPLAIMFRKYIGMNFSLNIGESSVNPGFNLVYKF